MDDETLRSLERDVQAGDLDARGRLTELFLSSGRGQVCLWRPPKAAPPGAVRAALRIASAGGKVRAEGLALAVVDAADAISLVKSSGRSSWDPSTPIELIDLETGENVRVTTQEADATTVPSRLGGPPLAARALETPLWDRMLVPARHGETWFFHYAAGGPMPWSHDVKSCADTNMTAPNYLPGNMREFRLDGISVVPDASADEEALRTVRDHGRFRIRAAGHDLLELPVRLLVPMRDEDEGAPALERSTPALRLRNVLTLENGFVVTIYVDRPDGVGDAPKAGMMVVLHGIGLVPIT